MPSTQMPSIHCRIPRHLLTNSTLSPSLKLLEEEVNECYLFSLRKGIGKHCVCYILLCNKLTTTSTEIVIPYVHARHPSYWTVVRVYELTFFRHKDRILQYPHRKIMTRGNFEYHGCEETFTNLAKTQLGSLQWSPGLVQRSFLLYAL